MSSPLAWSRRNFLAGLAAAGSTTLLSNGVSDALAQTARARRIDFHHHFASPAWISYLGPKEGRPVPGFTDFFNLAAWKDFSPARTIEGMDQGGCETAMLSVTTPGIWFGNRDETRRIAREMNEFAMAKMVATYKGRFGLFAVLPLPDIDGSLREIEYALDTLKVAGIGILTSYDNKWPGDPFYNPIFQELNRRKAIVYFHPTDAPCCQRLMPGVSPGTVEYNTDTSRAIVSLISGDAATRYGDIRFIFSHGGGTMPSLIERIGVGGPEIIADNLGKPAERNSKLWHLRRFYYDTAQSVNPVQMQGLKMVAGASQIVFGTDFPFGNIANHAKGLQKCGFSAQELQGIDRENALRLLPQYKS